MDSLKLDKMESLLVGLTRLLDRLDRELRIEEEVSDVGRMGAPVTERLYESVLRAGGVIPSECEPHLQSDRLSARFLSAVDRVTHVTLDTAPNRVTARVLELAARQLSVGAGDEPLEHRRARRLRARFVELRRASALTHVSPMGPDDMMHRSLRLAPKYRDVLRLHALLHDVEKT